MKGLLEKEILPIIAIFSYYEPFERYAKIALIHHITDCKEQYNLIDDASLIFPVTYYFLFFFFFFLSLLKRKTMNKISNQTFH